MKRLILLPVLLFSLNACSQANLSGIPGGYIQKHENFDKNRMGSYTDYCYYTYLSPFHVFSLLIYDKILK